MKDTVKRVKRQAILCESICRSHVLQNTYILNILRTLKTQQKKKIFQYVISIYKTANASAKYTFYLKRPALGLVPDHNKANCMNFFVSQVQVKVPFILYCSLLSM